MNFEIKKENWGPFFDNVSKHRVAWTTEIEVLGRHVGDQTLSNGLPLNGISVETVGSQTSIAISVGETTGHHQTHNIVDPARVAFLVGDDFHGDVVDIEEADGTKTLVCFTKPIGLLVGFREYKMQLLAA